MGTKIEFTATACGETVEWSADGKHAKEHQVNVNKGAKPEEIEIRIKSDASAKPLGLRVDCSNPFLVTVDDGCCPPSGPKTDQIEVLSCDHDSVTIRDLNTGPECDLRYQVNVVDKHGHAHPCDPIIRNGGAGPGVI